MKSGRNNGFFRGNVIFGTSLPIRVERSVLRLAVSKLILSLLYLAIL